MGHGGTCVRFSVASRELTSNVAKLRARLKAALSAREQADMMSSSSGRALAESLAAEGEVPHARLTAGGAQARGSDGAAASKTPWAAPWARITLEVRKKLARLHAF